MLSADSCYLIFEESIREYHRKDNVDAPLKNPYPPSEFKALLYQKNWIDTVQWHLEDMIRKPEINPYDGILIKRRIDQSNQERTDTVETMDDYFLEQFAHVTPNSLSRINSETPAWLLDRMSILMLKIYHMKEQTERHDVDSEHLHRCQLKLNILLEQKNDMGAAFDELIEDIGSGNRRFKIYRQMKMYNDATLNPMLYNRQDTRK